MTSLSDRIDYLEETIFDLTNKPQHTQHTQHTQHPSVPTYPTHTPLLSPPSSPSVTKQLQYEIHSLMKRVKQLEDRMEEDDCDSAELCSSRPRARNSAGTTVIPHAPASVALFRSLYPAREKRTSRFSNPWLDERDEKEISIDSKVFFTS